MIAEHNFGLVAGSSPEKTLLTGTYTAIETGIHTLKIRNRRNLASSTLLENYIDNITLAPKGWMLGSNGVTLSGLYGSTRLLNLDAGVEHANQDYVVLMGYSGTWPSLAMNGVPIPLKWDYLVKLSMFYPGFPGAGFAGTLNHEGKALATFVFPPDMSLVGLTLHFSYIVLSPGGGLPVVAASNPINMTVTITE